ncbi:MAG TPA: extracellular solute-binding protein [Acidimicrobiales bacterium]|nr:extracellular solute-binding protein [Acidimicrobiales bacterium]
MPWGEPIFNTKDKELVEAYKPAHGLPAASYQVVQWANFTQVFSSAIDSNTGPAVSSGGGTQVFLYDHQGKIAHADHLLDSWKSNGLYNDFLPGLLSSMKTKAGYVAVPYNLDMRVLWYSKPLLDRAGAKVPTDWQSYLDAAAALKKINVYGYGTGAGSGNYTGDHILVSWMINNGGGLFDADQKPNCVTPQNIEAMNFVLEMVHKGYVDPACPTYTSQNVQTQWKDQKFGLGFDTGGLAENIGGSAGKNLFVGTPLASPSGKKGMIYFPNNIMMYKNTPSQKGSEAFLTYYYQNMKKLWTAGVMPDLPPLKSITSTSQFQSNANNVKIIKEWQPISHTWGAPGGEGLFLGVTTVDGTQIMNNFTQAILGGRTTAKAALTTLQSGIESAMKSL